VKCCRRDSHNRKRSSSILNNRYFPPPLCTSPPNSPLYISFSSFIQLHSMHQLLTTTTDALNANIQRYESLKEQAELKDRNTKMIEEERIKLRRVVEVHQYKMSRLADRLQVSLFVTSPLPPNLPHLTHFSSPPIQVTQREKSEWKELFARAQHQLDIFCGRFAWSFSRDLVSLF
jgi:hypothetical protein